MLSKCWASARQLLDKCQPCVGQASGRQESYKSQAKMSGKKQKCQAKNSIDLSSTTHQTKKETKYGWQKNFQAGTC
jgi:hypothetical protein